jgi:heterodisulfide reductase subunit C
MSSNYDFFSSIRSLRLMVMRMVRQRLIPSSRLAEELASLPGGEIIETCLRCGVCTASCAISSASGLNPRKIIQKILVGAREPVLNSEQPWLCMTCNLCENKCQYGVMLEDVFGLVREIAVQEGIVPPAFVDANQTILRDGWLLKKANTDFVLDQRRELGLSSRLTWNNRYTGQVWSKYFGSGVKK